MVVHKCQVSPRPSKPRETPGNERKKGDGRGEVGLHQRPRRSHARLVRSHTGASSQERGEELLLVPAIHSTLGSKQRFVARMLDSVSGVSSVSFWLPAASVPLSEQAAHLFHLQTELCPSLFSPIPHFCPKSNFVTGAEAATNISFIASANLSGSLRHKMSLPVNFEQPLVWAPQRSPRGGTPERLRKL